MTMTADALQQLLDEKAIHDVSMRYTFCLDARDWPGVAEVFSTDAWIDYQDLPPGPPAEFLPRLRATIEQFATTQHLLTGQLVAWEGERAAVRSSAIAYHRTPADAVGQQMDLVAGVHYDDVFEHRGGRWLITRRTVTTPWLRQDVVTSGKPMVPDGM
jgi:hypothetical protein